MTDSVVRRRALRWSSRLLVDVLIVAALCAVVGVLLKADTVLAGDLGCLMNMAGKLQRDGSTVKARHIAEILAGMADGPAIGEGKPEAAR